MHICLSGNMLPATGAALAHDTRAFRQGYALVETILLRNGRMPLGDLHWQRLFNGLEALQIAHPGHFSPEFLEEKIFALARKNAHQELGRVRLQLWPGNGGITDPYPATPHYLIETRALEEAQVAFNENGLVLGMAEGLQKSPDATASLKTANALLYALAMRRASARGWNDALILNTGGRIIESCIANIFWVKEGQVYTPPLAEGCVAGVMRRHLLETVLPAAGVPFSENPLTVETLLDADEVFITNAVRGVRWVGRVGEAVFQQSASRRIAHAAGLYLRR